MQTRREPSGRACRTVVDHRRMLRHRAGVPLTLAFLIVVGGVAGAVREGVPQDLRFEDPGLEGRWYQGNTHTHTLESDGDSTPEAVAGWYRRRGYDFVVFTDHGKVTPSPFPPDDDFLVIGGEEVTAGFEGAPVHVNGINLPYAVEARIAETLVETLRANVAAVRAAGGVPQVNHPNFQWAFGAEALAAVEGPYLLEISSGHPTVHSAGGGGVPSVEEMWDEVLTRGRRVWGVAVDDSHHFQEDFTMERATPGRAWIVVRAPELSAGAIAAGLEAGRFYASSGVDLDDLRVEPTRLEVRIRQRGDFRYTTTFIGAGGRPLAESFDNPATLVLAEHDSGALAPVGVTPYVRARVVDSGGRIAWTQPVFLIND